MDNSGTELYRISSAHHDGRRTSTATERRTSIAFSLPPADRGRAAWLVLAAAFIIEAPIWGFPFSFGVFQEHYSALPEFEGQQSQVPIVGTVANGLLYLASPLSLMLYKSYPHRRRHGMAVGVLVLTASLIGASFARNVSELILTQGVLYGIAGGMIYYPIFLFIDEWFVHRKGLAFGITWGSTGLSGLVVPYAMSWLLESYGFRTTLRIWAVCCVVLILPCLIVLKPRLPSSTNVLMLRPKLAFVLNPTFFAFEIGNIIEGLGFFLPGIYLPSYAVSQGFGGAVATTSLSLLNVGSFLGCIILGFLGDRWPVSRLVFVVTVGATVSLTLIWGFASSAAVTIIFALSYGFFAGSFVTTWPAVVREVVNRDLTRTAEPSIVYSLLVLGRGVGSVLSGPLSQALLQAPRLTESITYGYGSGFGILIVFTAITAVCAGLGPICWKFRVV